MDSLPADAFRQSPLYHARHESGERQSAEIRRGGGRGSMKVPRASTAVSAVGARGSSCGRSTSR